MLHWYTHFYSTSQIKVYIPFSNYDCSKVRIVLFRNHFVIVSHPYPKRYVIPFPQGVNSYSLLIFFPRCTYIEMLFSSYKNQRILFFYAKGYKVPTIAKLLREESLPCSRVGVTKFIKLFKETGTITSRVGSGRPSKVTVKIRHIVEDQMWFR